MQTTTRTALVLAVLLTGCGTDQTPVTPSDARPHYDGVHTFGSGNRAASTTDSVTADTTTASTRGVHTFGSGT